MSRLSLHDYTPAHWPGVQRAYQQGIDTGQATFETKAPDEPTWAAKFIPGLCIVATAANGDVTGWAGAVASSDRCAYAGVAEVSVYVAEHAQGQGVGQTLLNALIARSESAGIWTLQAGIFPQNSGSIGLHTRCGFRLIGRREALGQLKGVWQDVNLYERRSAVVGRD